MEAKAKLFFDIGEPLMAGYYEQPNVSIARRFCRGYRRFYETCDIPAYNPAEPLYPSGSLDYPTIAVIPQYCRQYRIFPDILEKKSSEAVSIMKEFNLAHDSYLNVEGCEEVRKYTCGIDSWNHSALDFKHICLLGLNGYEERVRAMKDEDMREALLDLLIGIRTYHKRCLTYLESVSADEKLIKTLRKMPLEPASDAYEALVSVNFMLYFDQGDNLGYVDGWLPLYWKGEDLSPLLHCIMKNVLALEGWTISLGPEYSDLTRQWLYSTEGLDRPLIELRVTKDMPDEIWNVALERVLSGTGQPAFYNEEALQARFAKRLPDAHKEDLITFCGMGCTETSFSGMSFSGGIDLNLNVLKVFEEFMHNSLEKFETFEAFYLAFEENLHNAQDNVMNFINRADLKRAETLFAPIRTLFTEGCIESETGYYQGGPKYVLAIPADSGIPNTVDSLLAIKELIYDKKRYSAQEFLQALHSQDADFIAQLRQCPCYGVNNPEADALMTRFTDSFYTHYERGTFVLGQGFFPTSHQFKRHVQEGAVVGATPDGRKAGESLADSIAALNGKAVDGPTAMLCSAANYSQEKVYGIPVLNLSIVKETRPEILRSLIESYFQMGGTQIQITCTSREELLDAQKNPDAHRDLVVRVGGYSAYFCDLTNELQNAVINRTLF